MGTDSKKKEYKQIQFLAWEIYTGPVRNDDMVGIGYAGIRFAHSLHAGKDWDVLAQCIDIEVRLAVTQRALETALSHANSSEDVLKIFMAPEFLYRGPAGAYINELLNGWERQSPFENLYPPFQAGWGGLMGGLRALVADKKFENWIFVFGTAVSASFYRADDGQSKATADNIALVQCGGLEHENDCFYVKKQLISPTDFLNFTLDHPDFVNMAIQLKHDG